MVEDPIEQKINKNNPRNFREIFKKNLLSIPMVDLERTLPPIFRKNSMRRP